MEMAEMSSNYPYARTYVRIKGGFAEPPSPRLGPDHPLVRGKYRCPVCNDHFQADDVVCLTPIGAEDAGDRSKAYNGGYYSATALVIHNCCAIVKDEVAHSPDAGTGEGVKDNA